MTQLMKERPWAAGRRVRCRLARHGFTLIELLVVIAIIAILAAVASRLFATQRQVLSINLGKANLNLVRQAIHNYWDAEGVIPTNWHQLRDGGYIDDTYLVAMDGLSAVKDGYRFTLRSSGCAGGAGCTAGDSPIIVDAKPLSPVISSVDLAIKDDGEIVSKVDEAKVKAQEQILAEIKVDAAKAIVKAVGEYGETDVAGAMNSVSDADVKKSVAIITGGDGKFDKDDLSKLAGTESEPRSALEEFCRKLQVKLEIGTAGKADDAQVEIAEDFKLKEDWPFSIFDWNYYIGLVTQIENEGSREALLSVGEAAAQGEERTPSNAGRLYDAIEKQINAFERNGEISTELAARLREFLSVRRL